MTVNCEHDSETVGEVEVADSVDVGKWVYVRRLLFGRK
jgi:hypothetical protein